jgi:putative PIN family toxin of toxin-antitoxin system
MVGARKEKPKLIVDTSVLLAWCMSQNKSYFDDLISPSNNNKYSLVTSFRLLNETTVKIRQKFESSKLRKNIVAIEAVFEWFLKRSEIKLTQSLEKGCRDEDDNFILDLAIQSEADYIISLDRDLLDMQEYKGVRIVKPGEIVSELSL